MAEYSKSQIKTFTQQANQTPQFAPPSQSLGADIVNAIGTGLQFYQQQQAKDALADAAAQEKAYEQKLASGVLGYRDFRQNLIDQKIPKAQRRVLEKRFFEQYDETTQMEIISATNKLTKRTAADVDDEISEQQKLTEQKVNKGFSYLTEIKGIDPAEAQGMTEEQLVAASKQADRLAAQIETQKSIIEVSDDITEPVLTIQRTVFQEKVQTQLSQIREAFRRGDSERAIALGDTLRKTVMTTAKEAPNAIKTMMNEMGKGAFYNANLVNSYTENVMGILEDPTVKDVLSGKETNTEKTNAVMNKINAAMGDKFFELTKKVQGGTATQKDISYYADVVEHFSNKDIKGLTISAAEGVLLDAVSGGKYNPIPLAGGGNEDDANARKQVTDTSNSVFDFITNGLNYLTRSEPEAVKKMNGVTAEFINEKLDNGKELSEKDIGWVVDSLTFGRNKNNTVKGSNASKQLKSPLSILSRPDYDEKVKPIVDAQRAEGVDVSESLTYALQNHIQNNFKNAFNNLTQLATSGTALSSETKVVRKDTNFSDAFYSGGNEDLNTRDLVELTNKDGVLRFKAKRGRTTPAIDSVVVGRIRSYNNTLSVINDFITAMGNVNEVDKKDVANEVMFLLGRDLNIPLEELSEE